MEMIDIYNEAGVKTGETVEKYETHREGLIHRAVCVWIVNSRNEVLMQTRSDHVLSPGKMDISFSGHIQAGETSLEAAVREGYEELGISIDISRLRYLFSCRVYAGTDEYTENEIDDVYLYKADIPLDDCRFYDNEVKAVSYVPLEKLKAMVEMQADVLVPSEIHYRFFLTTMDSRLIKRDNG